LIIKRRLTYEDNLAEEYVVNCVGVDDTSQGVLIILEQKSPPSLESDVYKSSWSQETAFCAAGNANAPWRTRNCIARSSIVNR
jgi:hypothetical protein